MYSSPVSPLLRAVVERALSRAEAGLRPRRLSPARLRALADRAEAGPSCYVPSRAEVSAAADRAEDPRDCTYWDPGELAAAYKRSTQRSPVYVDQKHVRAAADRAEARCGLRVVLDERSKLGAEWSDG